MLNSTERFSSRVDNYAKYRPSYPWEVVDLLAHECRLGAKTPVADVGAGTGILTELLLKAGAEVFAIEPNADMRRRAEELLDRYPLFRSVNGTAEATTLPDARVDLIVAGQAFHWFDPLAARREFSRVLRPLGWIALIWNERPLGAYAFLDDYDALLKAHAPEYDQVSSRRVDEDAIRRFFEPGAWRLATFANRQEFDYEGLKGRLLSSSYAPEPGDPNHEPMMTGLRSVFERHARGGRVPFDYRTLVYYGRLT
jgi:SAM-dependent methyltransferase